MWRPQKKHTVVMSGEQPVLVFKDEAPVGKEAAEGMGQRNTAPTSSSVCLTRGSVFEDLYAVHVAGVHCKVRAGLVQNTEPRVCKGWHGKHLEGKPRKCTRWTPRGQYQAPGRTYLCWRTPRAWP